MRSLLTLPGTFGMLRVEPKNSSVKVRQHLKRGSFFGVRTLEKYGVYSVISGREWVNRIPCKGEYARRSQTVLSSRPFLRPAEGQLRKSVRFPMFRFLLSSRWTRFQYRLVSSLQSFLCRAAATAVFGAVLALPVLYFVEVAR